MWVSLGWAGGGEGCQPLAEVSSLSMHWTVSDVWIGHQTVWLMWWLCGCSLCFRQRVNMWKGYLGNFFYNVIRQKSSFYLCPVLSFFFLFIFYSVRLRMCISLFCFVFHLYLIFFFYKYWKKQADFLLFCDPERIFCIYSSLYYKM